MLIIISRYAVGCDDLGAPCKPSAHTGELGAPHKPSAHTDERRAGVVAPYGEDLIRIQTF